ncbi:response regulator [uncultured Desulfobacter sp.]|uniref:response regulator n=1 Tax=uncultured Desulfobacter sp. TaxID=240139 RepID=UPI0029F4B47D|nr:response regulator [uncultured Desulfobacter sp.]
MNQQRNSYQPILLVEDNPLDIDLTRRAFKKQNLTNHLDIARDGEEAISWLSRWEAGEPLPLIILMDLKLPKIGGLEVLRKYKEQPGIRNIPIVVLTSSSQDTDITTAYEYGANSYIVKPVDFDKFVKVATEIKMYWLGTTLLPRML